MKRSMWFTMAVLAVASTSAAAEWVAMGNNGQADIYIDKTTITRSGDTARMWSLQELKQPGSAGGAAYVSLKRQDEYDCKEPRTRGVEISAFPEPMAQGKAVASEKGSSAWAKIAPGSVSDGMWRIACGKE
ncbi:MAG TPA: hypothetical protein PLG77_13480 [Burkholderiaceae bacterium]|nr:hypothetical protein [Burkholderiaceae bacterium]